MADATCRGEYLGPFRLSRCLAIPLCAVDRTSEWPKGISYTGRWNADNRRVLEREQWLEEPDVEVTQEAARPSPE